MNKMFLILGKGFLGTKLRDALNCNISGERVNSLNDAKKIIEKHKPKILINCIGHTGKGNVDGCELDKDKTLQSNAFVPIILTEIAIRYNIKLVHIDSGCIYHYRYGKDMPITESKIPDYFDLFYSRSKIYSERAIEPYCNKYQILMLRIRVPLDYRPDHKNLLTKLVNYKKAIDIPNSITYIPDFLKAAKYLININAFGIYNVVNKGSLRYPELLEAYKKYVPNFKYRVIKFKKLKLSRTNVLLSTRKLEKSGFKVRNIKEVLEECVKEYVKYK